MDFAFWTCGVVVFIAVLGFLFLFLLFSAFRFVLETSQVGV